MVERKRHRIGGGRRPRRWWGNRLARLLGLHAGNSEAASAAYQHYLELRDANPADESAIAAATASLDTDYAGTSYQVLSLLHRAADAVNADDLERAAAVLATAVAQAGDQRLADLARVRLARVQHQRGDDAAALSSLGGVKGAGFRSYAAEIKGDILLAQGNEGEALAAYRAAADVEGADGDRAMLKLKISDLTPPESMANGAEPDAQ
ncbi:MAG: tetratricopeptide repeat protein [Gammaproteobacteria bacterium]|nr:tetratricopeptide repeat protein [Gammaproteobacteria bacterium]